MNLYLEIGEKRPDGYHEAISILHALDLHDTIEMRLLPAETGTATATTAAGDAHVSGLAEADAAAVRDAAEAGARGLQVAIEVETAPGIPPLDIRPEDNIMFKALHRLAAALGRAENERIEIRAQKEIPFQAGLGGGSSNAAAVLAGAALLWGVPRDEARLEEVARTLGADVPFFLRGACDCLLGAGDVHDHALEPLQSPLCLIKPAGGVSTAAAYQAFDAAPVRLAPSDHECALAAAHAGDVPLRNNLFEAAMAVQPQIAQLEDWLEEQRSSVPGMGDLLISGSGSALFVCCETPEAAERLAHRAQDAGYWAKASRFSAQRAEASSIL